jgi:methylmalonyl-CoA mutase C-terminal domain/subunit
LLAGLKARGVDDMIVVGGGVMPDEDVVALKQMGVHEILLQDTPPNEIIATIERLVAERGER